MIAVWFAVYVASIVLANVMTAWFGLVPVGFGLVATAGTYAAGFALLARDFVHRYGGAWWALAGIVLGIVLSWFLASPALAVASAAAFAVAELVDLVIYSLTRRRRGFIASASISNVVSAPLDTVVFLLIAGFPLTLATFAGQMVGKLLWATALPLAFYWIVTRPWRFARVTTADPAPWVVWNRYPSGIIGAAFKTGERQAFSIVWAKPDTSKGDWGRV